MDVKKILFGLGILLVAAPLLAIEQDDDQLVKVQEGGENPFMMRFSSDFIGRSDIDKHYYSGHINFNSSCVNVGSVVWYKEAYKEGAMIEVGFDRTHMKWNDNPFFKKSNYDTFSLGGLLFTQRACDWDWKLYARWNLDTDHPEFSHYSTYDMFLWGRYTYTDLVGLHFGVYAETGMKVDRVYPIIGFDWQYSDRFSIHAAFPFDVKLMYMLGHNWCAELCFHFFRERHRAGKHEELPEAIWVYENYSIDSCICYQWNENSRINFHVGWALGGDLKIANKNYDDKEHFDFNGAGVIGMEGSIKF